METIGRMTNSRTETSLNGNRVAGLQRRLSSSANSIRSVGSLSHLFSSPKQKLTNFNLTLHGTFSRLLAETPAIRDAVAVIEENNSLTFARLDRLSDYVMIMFHSETETNWPSNFNIAIAMKPSLERIIFLLGILKLGAAFVPINPLWNDHFIAKILDETKPKALICDDFSRFSVFSSEMELIDANNFLKFAEEIISEKNSITITFSKSSLPAVLLVDKDTVNKKRTAKVDRLSHQIIMNRLAAHWTKLPYASDEVVISKAPLTSTDSLLEIFGPLLIGHAVLILPEETLNSPSDFFDTLEAFPVHRFTCDPATLSRLCASFQILSRKLTDRISVKLVLVSGKVALDPELALRFFEYFSSTKLGRTFELTELAGDVAWSIFDSQEDLLENIVDETIPCGSLIPNMEILICDETRNSVPIGDLGDLFVRTTFLNHFPSNFPKNDEEISVLLGSQEDWLLDRNHGDWIRTGKSAFINPKNGLLYVKMARYSSSQNSSSSNDTDVSDEDCDEIETESSAVLSFSIENLDRNSELEEEIFYESEDITEQNLDDALQIVVANTFLRAVSDLPEFEQLTVSDLQEYAQKIIRGTIPKNMNFILRNKENKIVAVNVAFDPWATPQSVQNLMVSPDSPKSQVVSWILCPFTSTLPQEPGVILESYLMSADDVLSPEDKFKIYCQLESELESRAKSFGFQYILTKNYDALMRGVCKYKGYQRWASYQLNKIALPSGDIPFCDAADSDRITLDVRVLSFDEEHDIPTFDSLHSTV